MKGLNKSGQSSMTLGTILSIVLGLAVVVVLIWGFSVGWNTLWDKVTGRISSSNADAVVSGCQLACDTGSIDDYCNVKKTLKFGEERDVQTQSDPVRLKELQDAITAANNLPSTTDVEKATKKAAVDVATKALADYNTLLEVTPKKEVIGSCMELSGYEKLGNVKIVACASMTCPSVR